MKAIPQAIHIANWRLKPVPNMPDIWTFAILPSVDNGSGARRPPEQGVELQVSCG